ncbi:hypothetical protein H4V99_003390 [Cryobacterium sp. CG_9.6]|nr:hypothetical protein [Cryobacterium sp. CG_9.6]
MTAHSGVARSAVSFASCGVARPDAIQKGRRSIAGETGGRGSVTSMCGRFVVPSTTGELLSVFDATGDNADGWQPSYSARTDHYALRVATICRPMSLRRSMAARLVQR